MKFAFEQNKIVFWMIVTAAGLTAFYITRVCIVAFFGTPRTEQARTAPESPLVMTIPLIMLSIPAIFSGYPLITRYFIAPLGSLELPKETPAYVELIFILFFLVGTVTAWAIYRKASKDPIEIPLLVNRFYIDALYDWCVEKIQGGFANAMAFIDRWVIDGFIVQGIASLIWSFGFVLRFLQVGNLQAYTLFLGGGVIGIIVLLMRIH
jgi:NADH-quinone oxidoreductase subunit L